MRRAIVAILAILYLTASGGVGISAHWCMGKLSGTSLALLGSDDHHACKRCGMEKKKRGGCCHDEHTFIKAAKDHTLASKMLLQVSAVLAEPVKLFFPSSPPCQASTALVAIAPAHGPPLATATPIYLRIRSIRI